MLYWLHLLHSRLVSRLYTELHQYNWEWNALIMYDGCTLFSRGFGELPVRKHKDIQITAHNNTGRSQIDVLMLNFMEHGAIVLWFQGEGQN